MNSQEFDIAKLENRIELMQNLLTQMIATAAYRMTEVEALKEDNEKLNRDVENAKEHADILATIEKEYHKEIDRLKAREAELEAEFAKNAKTIDSLTKQFAEARQDGSAWLKPGTPVEKTGMIVVLDGNNTTLITTARPPCAYSNWVCYLPDEYVTTMIAKEEGKDD